MAKGKKELLRGQDGFYIGRVLKNGNLSADSYKVSDREILAMFEDYLTRYCLTQGKNVLEIGRGGKTLFEAKLYIR